MVDIKIGFQKWLALCQGEASTMDCPLIHGKGLLTESALRFKNYTGYELWWMVGDVFVLDRRTV